MKSKQPKQPTQQTYEQTAKARMKTKPVPLGTPPLPPTLAKPLKRGGK